MHLNVSSLVFGLFAFEVTFDFTLACYCFLMSNHAYLLNIVTSVTMSIVFNLGC